MRVRLGGEFQSFKIHLKVLVLALLWLKAKTLALYHCLRLLLGLM